MAFGDKAINLLWFLGWAVQLDFSLVEYFFIAIDNDGNEAACSHLVSEWIDVLPVSVTPEAGDIFPDTDSVQWDIDWGIIGIEFDTYDVKLSNDIGFYWRKDFTSVPIDYDGDPIPPGEYQFNIFCLTPDMEAEFQITGYFNIDDPPPP